MPNPDLLLLERNPIMARSTMRIRIALTAPAMQQATGVAFIIQADALAPRNQMVIGRNSVAPKLAESMRCFSEHPSKRCGDSPARKVNGDDSFMGVGVEILFCDKC